MNKIETIRVAIPLKFRKKLPESLIVNRGLDKSLMLFSQTEWKKKRQKLLKIAKDSKIAPQSRQFVKLLIKGVCPAKMDKSGHVVVPNFLAEYAGIKKNVVIVPADDKQSALLIWAKEVFKNMRKSYKGKNFKGTRFENYFQLI